MKQRVITGVLGAAGFLLILRLGHWWYSGLVFLLAILTFLEYSLMKKFDWKQPQVLLGIATVWLILMSGLTQQHALPSYPLFQEPYNILSGLVLFFVLIVLSRNHFDIDQMSYLLVGSLYIGYGFSYMMQTIWKPNGVTITLLVIIVTWASDSGAYFIGKKFGKRKLWPDISPNKTVEGSLGGVLFGVVASQVVFVIQPQLGSNFHAIVLGIVISVVGQVGDLVESAIKRTTGVKDSGTILPGHGGLLDRFDSLLFTFIVLFLTHLI